jgi:hypothetical protein
MEISQFQIISILLGTFVGIVLALTGAGGAIIAIPLLVFGLHLGLLQAAPIGLLAVMLAAGMAALMGLRAGIVRYKAASLLACCGLLTAPLGVWLAHVVSNLALAIIFSAVLIYVAITMFIKAQKAIQCGTAECMDSDQPCRVNQQIGKFSWNAPCAHAMVLSGTVAGFFSGLLGVGGGFIIVPALRKFTNLDMKSIVATSLAAIALVSGAGVLVYAAKGVIEWHLALPFVIGGLFGMMAGQVVAKKLAGARIQQAFSTVAFLIAIGLLIKALT